MRENNKLRVPSHMNQYRFKNKNNVSKSLAEYVLKEYSEEGKKVLGLDEIIQKMKTNGVAITDENKYSAAIAFSQMYADYHPTSMQNEQCLMQGVRAVLEKEKKHPGWILMHYYLDHLIEHGEIDWNKMM